MGPPWGKEGEREKEKLQEEALEAVTSQYLASNAFGIVRADFFWEGFEDFWDLVVKPFPDLDFSSIMLDEGGADAEEEQEEETDQGGKVALKGAVEEAKVTKVEEAEVIDLGVTSQEEVS